jgi:hypothetical protein
MLQKKIPLLEEEGYARRDGNRWLFRREGLEVIYDGLTRTRSDSPRLALFESEGRTASGPRPPDETRRSSPPMPASATTKEREELKEKVAFVDADPMMPRSEAERQIKVFQRRLLELDLAEREGQLVDVKSAKMAVFEKGRRIRDLLLGIPARAAADLAAESDPAAVAILLEKALVEALEGLHAVV